MKLGDKERFILLMNTMYEEDELACHKSNSTSEYYRRYGNGEFLSGSSVEGACICRGISNDKQVSETDVMRPIGKISQEVAEQILIPTEHTGYYNCIYNLYLYIKTKFVSQMLPK